MNERKNPAGRPSVRLVVGGGIAAVVLAAASTLAIAAASSGTHGVTAGNGPGGTGPLGGMGRTSTSTCTIPSLPGDVVDVTLTDMGAMMGGAGNDRGSTGMMGRGSPAEGQGWNGAVGPMSATVDPATVGAGSITLAVTNAGWRTHELVVLPLRDGAQPGERAVGPDDTVSEDSSLGEASADCSDGEGDGIAAGSAGWVTLDLAPGRYELLCNLPGHYAAGMYTELDVTS